MLAVQCADARAGLDEIANASGHFCVEAGETISRWLGRWLRWVFECLGAWL
jgi:hypothetical protein